MTDHPADKAIETLVERLRNAVLVDRGFDERWPLNPPLAPHSLAELARDNRWAAADAILATASQVTALQAEVERLKAPPIKCEMCHGTGKIQRMSFKSADATTERTCTICKGTGWLADESRWRDRATSAEAEVTRLRAALGEIESICAAPAPSTSAGERELQLADAVQHIHTLARTAGQQEKDNG
jgi:hypothetical protein